MALEQLLKNVFHSVTRKATPYLAAGIMALTPFYGCGDDGGAVAGCMTNQDCKGERVCYVGECVDEAPVSDVDATNGSDVYRATDVTVPAETVGPNCSNKEWECNNGSCITEAYLCDGEFDCSNGEDENNCEPVIDVPAVDCSEFNEHYSAIGDECCAVDGSSKLCIEEVIPLPDQFWKYLSGLSYFSADGKVTLNFMELGSSVVNELNLDSMAVSSFNLNLPNDSLEVSGVIKYADNFHVFGLVNYETNEASILTLFKDDTTFHDPFLSFGSDFGNSPIISGMAMNDESVFYLVEGREDKIYTINYLQWGIGSMVNSPVNSVRGLAVDTSKNEDTLWLSNVVGEEENVGGKILRTSKYGDTLNTFNQPSYANISSNQPGELAWGGGSLYVHITSGHFFKTRFKE